MYVEVITATYPPGAVSRSDLMMKWSWIECRSALCVGSVTENSPKGTLPTTAWNESSGSIVFSNPAAWICWSGCRCAAIRAVVWSTSTPTMRAPSGASPRNSPEPHPGSSTAPSSNPAVSNTSHIAAATAESV